MKIYFRLLQYLKPYIWPYFLIATVCMLAFSSTDGAMPFLIRWVVDDVFTNKNQAALAYLPFVVISIFAIRGLMNFGQRPRLAWLTYVMARFLVRVNYIGMVNIVAGERVVPELIQAELTAERIVRESELILRDSELRQRMVAKLAEVRGKLGSPGAAGRVADIALAMMN